MKLESAIQEFRRTQVFDSEFSHFLLGTAAEKGVGVPQSYTEALTLYSRASQLGHAFALPRMVNLLERIGWRPSWHRFFASEDRERVCLVLLASSWDAKTLQPLSPGCPFSLLSRELVFRCLRW